MINKLKAFGIENKWRILGILLIFLCTYVVGLQKIELPGIYFDAVYPDYIAAVGAFPEVDNFTQITQHAGLPLLGNFYHGTLTAAVQFLVLKCVGQASVYTLRLTNLFYIAVIGSILFIFTQKISKKYIVPLICALLCVTSQNAIAFSRTQYYIMLPGVVFFLLSICVLLSTLMSDEKCDESKLLLSGIFQGVAFYGYFSFLFLAPASIVMIFFKMKPGQKLMSVVIYSWGILLGSILYFFAYYDSLLVNILGISNGTKVLLIAGCMLILLFFLLPVLVMVVPKYKSYRKRIVKIYLALGSIAIALGIVVILGIVFLLPEKLAGVFSLLSLSQTRNDGSRLTLFWTILYQLLSNDCSQRVIFREYIDDLGGIYVFLCTIITVIALGCYCIRGRRKEQNICGKYLLCKYSYLFGFYICSLPIVTGMQPQHFVVMYFVMFLMISFGMLYISTYLNKYISGVIAIIFLILGAGTNIYNNQLFIEMLDQTGGRGRYSIAYNEFAYSAYADEHKSDKVYVFPEWGFNANFIYLTSNTCKTVRDADIDVTELQKKLNSGLTVVIAASDENMVQELKKQLNYETEQKVQWTSVEGTQDFISVEISSAGANKHE